MCHVCVACPREGGGGAADLKWGSHTPALPTHSGHSAHHSIGADGVWVTATIVPVIAFVHIMADLKGQTRGRTGPKAGLPQQSQSTSPEPQPTYHKDPVSSLLAPGPHKAKNSSPRSTRPDLFAGAGIVDAHAGHPSASVASRTGFAVEAGHGVDAAGPREARVSVSTLRDEGGSGQALACALPTRPHCSPPHPRASTWPSGLRHALCALLPHLFSCLPTS